MIIAIPPVRTQLNFFSSLNNTLFHLSVHYACSSANSNLAFLRASVEGGFLCNFLSFAANVYIVAFVFIYIRFYPTSFSNLPCSQRCIWCCSYNGTFLACCGSCMSSRTTVSFSCKFLDFLSKLMITFRFLSIALAIFDTEKFSLDNNKTVCVSLFVSFLPRPIFYKYFTI